MKILPFKYLPNSRIAERWEGEPNEVFEEHYHPLDKTLWCEAGEITFAIEGEELVFSKGQTFTLPAGTRHSAVAGTSGCLCWESPKLDDNPTMV